MISEYEDDYLIEFNSEKDIDKLREEISSLLKTLEKRDGEIKRKVFTINYLVELLQFIVTRCDVSYNDLIEYAAAVMRKCWEVPTQEEFTEYLKSNGKKYWKNHKKGMKE